MSAISKAVERVGGQSALAKMLGISSQAVNKMFSSGKVPAERVLAIEKASGVSRHELRPDIYPVDNPSKAVVA